MSFDDEDDEKFIDNIITKQTNRSGNAANPTKGKQMSFHPKELVKGKPVITEEESQSITDWKEMQRAQALFRERHRMQGYKIDEIKPEGNALVIDQEKVNERKRREEELIRKLKEEDKKASKGVKHTVQGKSYMLEGGN